MAPVSNIKCLCLFAFLVFLESCSGFLLSESEQVSLESTGQLLPTLKQSIRVKEQLRAIRHLYPAVSQILHEADWVAGEVVVRRDELNSNIGVIKAINESEYGPLLPVVSSGNTDDSLSEVILSFNKPYNGIVFSQRLQKEFNVTTRPNYINYETRNQISFVNSAPTYITYTIKKCWIADDIVRAHYWEFTVAPFDVITVTLEKEYGDDLS